MNDYRYEEYAGVHRFTFQDTGSKTIAAIMDDISAILTAAPRDGRPIRLLVDTSRNMVEEGMRDILREVRRVENQHRERPRVRMAVILKQTPVTRVIEAVIMMTRGNGDEFRFFDRSDTHAALEWVQQG